MPRQLKVGTGRVLVGVLLLTVASACAQPVVGRVERHTKQWDAQAVEKSIENARAYLWSQWADGHWKEVGKKGAKTGRRVPAVGRHHPEGRPGEEFAGRDWQNRRLEPTDCYEVGFGVTLWDCVRKTPRVAGWQREAFSS